MSPEKKKEMMELGRKIESESRPKEEKLTPKKDINKNYDR